MGYLLYFYVLIYIAGSTLCFSNQKKFRELITKSKRKDLIIDLLQSLCAQFISFCLLRSVTQSSEISMPISIMIGYIPKLIKKNRTRKYIEERRKAWPLVVDQLASATASGVPLHLALLEMENRGPKQLKSEFVIFREEFQSNGSLERALNEFVVTARKNSPISEKSAQRLKSTILIARDCGGQEIGPILRNFSNYLRQNERTYNEIAVRQEWIKNGAFLASLTPWLLLLLLSLHTQAIRSYSNPGGKMVLLLGLVFTIVAYKWIYRISESVSIQSRN